ncbi:uncharacterized protein LOC116927779 [Daphnia magna]|uniref:Uncharacterized protein n=1 Tax=Daphnia magna TaxID=35525 RepID=A0ABQ9ZML8_9CRUS|nr:uncharacterized protein LOC116927779 [Daphnia magna]XP_032790733.1 uncharacterized protein LOC116927779 [Daphnia magna]KAK4014116.1 hypothetical protein OUZ56_026660 [Daphnia magna]
MNPVVVLLLAQMVAAQPVALPNPLDEWNTRPTGSSRVTETDAQPIRTRSLPQPSQSTSGNHAGPFNTKNGETVLSVSSDKSKNGTNKIITTTTTTEPSTQQATVDIETLPGFWLKNPNKVEESTGTPYEVDYRTERYRLDDLLQLNKKRKNFGHLYEDEENH